MSREVWNEKSSQQSGTEHPPSRRLQSQAPCPVMWKLFQPRQQSGQMASPRSPWGSFLLSLLQAAYPPPLPASHHHPPSHPHFVTPTAVSGCLCPHCSPVPSTSVRLYPEGRWGRRWCLCYSFTHMQVQG